LIDSNSEEQQATWQLKSTACTNKGLWVQTPTEDLKKSKQN